MTESPSKSPVLFIHGLWIHSSAWAPWIDRFETAGYPTISPGWPGELPTVEDTRAHPEGMNGIGIEDIYNHYDSVIESMSEKPIIVGHSFGGLIAQELIANDRATAAVAIDPAPIKGVTALPFSQLRSGFPVLGNPANKKRTVALTAKEFHYSLATRFPRMSRTNSSSDGRFPDLAVRSLRTPLPPSQGTRLQRSTPITPSAARSC